MQTSLTDVAKAAGVSVATASRVLAGADHPVANATRQKVLASAQQLGYRPNLVARSLRTDRSHTIGIIVENILSPFIPRIVRGIQDHLKQHDYFGIVLNSDWDPALETQAVERLRMRQIDGIIFVESFLRTAEEVEALFDRPYLFVHRLINSQGPNSIVPDDRHGARLAVRHLIKLGHRRIAYIGGLQEWSAAINRLAGYREELAASGLPYDEALVRHGDWQVQCGYLAAQELLSSRGAEPERPTAVFAANDLMAQGAIYAAQDIGLRVPDDLAVVGYDDRDFAGLVRPALTTVQMPCEKMGQVAAEAFLQLARRAVTLVAPSLV